jgi:hypothetical protein
MDGDHEAMGRLLDHAKACPEAFPVEYRSALAAAGLDACLAAGPCGFLIAL